MQQNKTIAVLLPCYNEAATIGKVVADFRKSLPNADIYVYDNNSTDGTAEKAKTAGAIVRYEYMQGKGNVVRRMFREIDADCYIMADGDDTYPAEYAPPMVEKVLAHQADMVVGDRLSSTYFEENKRAFHGAGNKLVRQLTRWIFKTGVTDIMTGYRAFSREFVKTFPVISQGFEIETEMTFHALDKRMQIENVVVEYRDRPEGSDSKLNTYSDGAKVLGTIVRLFKNYRPLLCLSLVAVLLVLVAAGLMAPILVEFVRTGLVPRFPTLIVCGFLVLTAIISFFSGLILDVQLHARRQEFELKRNTFYEIQRIREEWYGRMEK